MSLRQTDKIRKKLEDERSNRVIFLSHCILNENTRYFGGAFRKGAVEEVVTELVEKGVGLIQMKCPEQKAWGGVQKAHLWRFLGSRRGLLYRFRGVLIPLFRAYTRAIYRRLASEVIDEIAEYSKAECEIVGLVGVDGSPSCGVLKSLEMKCAAEILADTDIDSMDRAIFNNTLYSKCLTEGPGMFIEELDRLSKRRNIVLKFHSIDILGEMTGKQQSIVLG